MNEVIAGYFAGLSGVVVGYPLDTIKALIQTRGKSISSIAKGLNQIAFFRGLPLPVLSLPLNNSMLFGVYGYSLSYLNNGNRNEREANIKSIYFSGIVAGMATSFPKNPTEVLKIHLQTHDKAKISGLTDCIQQIIRTHGLKGLFRGITALVFRDSFSFGTYFLTYEMMRRKNAELNIIESQMVTNLISGGCAGAFAWLQVIPFDVIKSRLQADRAHKYRTIEMAFLIYKESGLLGFYKGLVPIIVRGFLVNSVILASYSSFSSMLNDIA